MPEKTIWYTDGNVWIIDQTLLPAQRRDLKIETPEQMWEAIKTLRVRGAPAIGVAAAFGVWLGVRNSGKSDLQELKALATAAADYLATSRPTAVNLFWAADRMKCRIANYEGPSNDFAAALLDEALSILEEDNEVCQAIGRHGAALLADGSRVLTHCNAGALATAQFGTALAPIYFATEKEGKHVEVIADETRPLLQGSRITAWELAQAGIPVTVICDNMAASVMRHGKVDCVIVGADRVAANGDFANKIGTYGVAVLARHHKIPFYVAVPLSTIDISIRSGDEIPIEQRDSAEITHVHGKQLVPADVPVYNPAFDVTPHEFVTGFITERGIIRAPFQEALAALFSTTAPSLATAQP